MRLCSSHNHYTAPPLNRETTLNMEYSLDISKQHKDFMKDLPGSFSVCIKRQTVLPKKDKNSKHIGDVEVFDTEAIYARLMCLIGLKQIDLEITLNYELAPIPTALFQDNGKMRCPKAKLFVFKTTLKVSALGRIQQDPAVLTIDGGALFWTID